MSNREHIPWANKMRRLTVGVTQQVEWMAPDPVVASVRTDFLETIGWLHDSALLPPAHQRLVAPYYLTDTYLQSYKSLLKTQADQPFIGVLRADHQIAVRYFSEDGTVCLVVDRQQQQRIATYHARTQARVFTQDLGDAMVVYQMRYDINNQRWKIAELVQQLPSGWGTRRSQQRIRELAVFPDISGRDS